MLQITKEWWIDINLIQQVRKVDHHYILDTVIKSDRLTKLEGEQLCEALVLYYTSGNVDGPVINVMKKRKTKIKFGDIMIPTSD